MIYVIGDSHVSFFKKDFPTLAVGSATAYGLLNENSYSQSKKKIEEFFKTTTLGNWLVVNFGEVDCRHHLNRFADRMKALDETIERYFKFIDTLKDYRVVIWCPIPNDKFEPTNKQQEKQGKYPIVGNYDDRLWITRCFCERIKRESLKRNIPVIDIFDLIVGRKNYYRDFVHLNKYGYVLVRAEIKKICI